MKKNKSTPSYEKIFEEIEKIVQEMDAGDISLEKSLEYFEKGMSLIKQGKDRLQDSEIRVNTLMNKTDSKSELDK